MNERIKELQEQCWEPRQYGPPWFNYKKFAELIVQECLTWAIDPQCFPKDHLTLEEAFRSGQEHSVRCIKEHFGVEE